MNKTNKKGRTHERIQKKLFQQCVKKIKVNGELKTIEEDAITTFLKDEVESFSDARRWWLHWKR